MNKKSYAGYIAGGIIVLLGIFVMVTYNGLVKKEEIFCLLLLPTTLLS